MAGRRCGIVASLAIVLISVIIPDVMSQCTRYYPPGAGLVNVTSFGATGDGVTDDTNAILAAFTSQQGNNSPSPGVPLVVYFPPGTYLVSDTLTWGFFGGGTDPAIGSCLSMRGSGVDVTIIKLKNAATGFGDPQNPKAVVAPRGGNNDNYSFQEYVRDMTINVGSGNPGAIAISYFSNNIGSAKDLKLITEGDAYAGVDLTRTYIGPCMMKRIQVIGFDYGINFNNGAPEYGVTFEEITLSNQKIAGFTLTKNPAVVRNLVSRQTSAPSVVSSNGAYLVLLDSSLTATSADSNTSAIINSGQKAYIRNVDTSGYAGVVSDGNSVKVAENRLEGEYLYPTSDWMQPFPGRGDGRYMLNLPIRETPMPYWSNDPNDWAIVPGQGGGSARRFINQAFATNKSVVWFPRGQAFMTGNFSVPAHVRYIVGFETHWNNFVPTPDPPFYLIVDQGTAADPPLVIEGILWSGVGGLIHKSSRTVAFLHGSYRGYYPQPGAGDFYMEDTLLAPVDFNVAQNVWLRQYNNEYRGHKITNSAANLWMMGLKTETAGTIVKTNNGARTELYGNLIYQTDSPNQYTDEALFIVDDASETAAWAYSVYAGNPDPPYLVETQNGITREANKTGLTRSHFMSSFADNWVTGVASQCSGCSLQYKPPTPPAGTCDSGVFAPSQVPGTDTSLTLGVSNQDSSSGSTRLGGSASWLHW